MKSFTLAMMVLCLGVTVTVPLAAEAADSPSVGVVEAVGIATEPSSTDIAW
ncbi:MAG: hypothetical protein AB1646_25360 [Thermodesulfobacteriota bacterium]